MNLLEHYIIEVISKEHIENYIKVNLKVDCYGSISNMTRYYTNEQELQEDISRGYFLA